MQTILFQGDSITDAGRSREDDSSKGIGYPTITAAKIGFDNPNQFKYINRGVSGNRIVDIYARMKIDIINLKPDYMSILIGVNDVWHELSSENGVKASKFEKIYSMLIEELLEELPNLKIMILEPFVLKGTATEENLDYFVSEVNKRAIATKNVANKFALTFVPLQEKFNEAAKLAPCSYWIPDGVHPSSQGHELISREWVKAFNTISK